MNEMGEFGRVSNEEHRGVVEDPIPISFVGPKLDRKPTGITSGIGRSRLASHGGEPNSGADLFADRTEKRLRCDVTEVMGYFEVTVGSSALSMDDSLRDPFTIEMRKEIDVVKVLEKQRSQETCTLSGIWLTNGCTVRSCVDGAVLCCENLLRWHCVR